MSHMSDMRSVPTASWDAQCTIVWCGWDGQGCGSVAPLRVPLFLYIQLYIYICLFIYGTGTYWQGSMHWSCFNGDFEFSPFCQFSVSLATSKLSFLQAMPMQRSSWQWILSKRVVATQVPFTRLPVPQSEAYERRSVWQWNNMTWHVRCFKREDIKAPWYKSTMTNHCIWNIMILPCWWQSFSN